MPRQPFSSACRGKLHHGSKLSVKCALLCILLAIKIKGLFLDGSSKLTQSGPCFLSITLGGLSLFTSS